VTEAKIAAHEAIAAKLRESITSGDLPVGASLPSEAELCAEYGTSRGPVRQAIATLAAEGLVVTSQGRAARVASRAQRQTVVEYMYFSRFARSVGGVAGARTVHIVRRPASVLEAVRLEIEAGAIIVDNLRLRLLNGEPTMLERSCFREDIGALLFGIDIDAGSITERLAAAGVDYAEFVQEIDAVAANEVDALHLGVAEGAPLLRQRRTVRDSSGRVNEYADDRYRPDLVTFTTRDVNPSFVRDISER
jgi:GntR family transcriptional regulator